MNRNTCVMAESRMLSKERICRVLRPKLILILHHIAPHRLLCAILYVSLSPFSRQQILNLLFLRPTSTININIEELAVVRLVTAIIVESSYTSSYHAIHRSLSSSLLPFDPIDTTLDGIHLILIHLRMNPLRTIEQASSLVRSRNRG